jgi:hypothetical protein
MSEPPTVRDLHRQAMDLAVPALMARQRGNSEEAVALARQALPLELAAAEKIAKTIESEPTRSILYLSAATLAYEAGDLPQAQRLIGEALSGYPSPKTEYDLLELLAMLHKDHWHEFAKEQP